MPLRAAIRKGKLLQQSQPAAVHIGRVTISNNQHLASLASAQASCAMSEAAPLIHVVDDDASFRRAVTRLLQASGYRVAHYESGDELLRSELSPDPGCILLDIHMSGLSGLQLQTHLNAMGSILPIVFL